MKKLLLLVACAAISFGAFAQVDKGERAVVIEGGVKSNPGRFMLGAQGRYNLADHVRIAPEALFVFPKDKVTGLDINVNLHYVFDLRDVTPDLYIYPLAGLSMQNYRHSGHTLPTGKKEGAVSSTNWGFNLGAGLDYNITSSTFLNLEMKYTFSDGDCFNVLIGYGIKF